MGDISEIQEAKRWIKARLLANADITSVVSQRVYADRAIAEGSPPTITFPYVLFNFLGGTDVQGLGINRQQAQLLFQVRIVTDGRPDTNARKVDKRIDDVLQAAANQLSGDYYFSARREQPIDRPEFDTTTNKTYHNLGGFYRLWIRRAA